MNAFQCELTGAFPVKMIVRRRADRGVLSHSSSLINSCACQADRSGTTCYTRRGQDDSPSETYLGSAAVVDMPDVVDLLLDVGKMLIEVGERVEIFSERLLDVRDGGIQGDVRAPLTMLRSELRRDRGRKDETAYTCRPESTSCSRLWIARELLMLTVSLPCK